jgi:hypothetical protein
MIVDEILQAMPACAIPEGHSHLWFVNKLRIHKPIAKLRMGKRVILLAGTYTFLTRLTEDTLYNQPPGEVVMEDTPFELRTHLNFALRARGQVLVTGLGLGCVVRGLLANPNVTHVTCIEKSPDVLALVAPYMPKERLTIVQADALDWTKQTDQHFDCAWHDLWTNKDNGEPHVDFWHTKLIMNCWEKATRQGAWLFPRTVSGRLKKKGFQWIG